MKIIREDSTFLLPQDDIIVLTGKCKNNIISGVRRKHDGTTRAFPRCLQRSAEVEYPLVEDTKRGR